MCENIHAFLIEIFDSIVNKILYKNSCPWLNNIRVRIRCPIPNTCISCLSLTLLVQTNRSAHTVRGKIWCTEFAPLWKKWVHMFVIRIKIKLDMNSNNSDVIVIYSARARDKVTSNILVFYKKKSRIYIVIILSHFLSNCLIKIPLCLTHVCRLINPFMVIQK